MPRAHTLTTESITTALDNQDNTGQVRSGSYQALMLSTYLINGYLGIYLLVCELLI